MTLVCCWKSQIRILELYFFDVPRFVEYSGYWAYHDNDRIDSESIRELLFMAGQRYMPRV